MDEPSWKRRYRATFAALSNGSVRTVVLLCCAIGFASCIDSTTMHESSDAHDDIRDVQEDAGTEHWGDVMPSDTEAALKLCNPKNILPIDCELLESWWWEGEEHPRWTFDLGTLDGPCELDVETSHGWLDVTYDSQTGYLSVEVLATELTTGRHFGSLTLHPCVEDMSSTVEIDARIFRKAPAGANAKVLVVGLDGVRPDALAVADTPIIDMLTRHAAYSFTARTQSTAPTKSGPGWASIMTGVEPDKHEVTNNLNEVLEGHNQLYPSFLQRAHEELGSLAVAAAHWAPVLLLNPADVLEEVALGNDPSVASQMSDFLYANDYDVHFLHLDDPDAAGHSAGFAVGNPLYLEAISNSDTYIGGLLDSLLMRPTIEDEDWLIVVTTDHGGGGFDHGAMNAENQTVFLVVAGTSVVPGLIPGPNVTHMDVHPTVMFFLGLPPKADWNLDGQIRGLF